MKKPLEVKEITFKELRNFFEKRIFAIPYIQREFVWTKKKIIALLDSVKKHYPIGSFLICKIPPRKHKYIRESPALPPFNSKKNKECYLVVDGHQRLSVIYSVIYEKDIKTSRYQYPIDSHSICLSQKQSKESEFEFYDTSKGNYTKLTDTLNKKTNFSSSKGRRIKECRLSFEKYTFPFIFIKGFDEKRMEEAFIRLNTGGTSLSQVDKIFAEAYHKDTDLRAHVNGLINHDLKSGFQYIDKIHIVKSIAANLGHKDFVGSTLDTFAKKLSNPKHEYHKEYKRRHKDIEASIKLAADFLTRKFIDASYIPYPAILSMLSIFFYANKKDRPSREQIKEIEKWFWVTGFTQRYSGKKQRDNLLNDAAEMKKLAYEKNHKINLEGKQRADKLSITYLSKIKYNSRSALKNTFFCYLIRKEPKELFNAEPIQIKDDVSSIFSSKNDHHIFPKAILNKYYDSDHINKVVNICFLTFHDNIRAKDDPPWDYLKKYKDNKDFDKILSSHIIPNDSCILREGDIKEKYEQFIKKRKELIKKDLISLMGDEYVED